MEGSLTAAVRFLLETTMSEMLAARVCRELESETALREEGASRDMINDLVFHSFGINLCF